MNGPAAVAGRALLLQEVLASVPAARPGEAADANEAVFVLPDRHDVPAITALLERLDARRGDLGIASYAVSDTALEEVSPATNTTLFLLYNVEMTSDY